MASRTLKRVKQDDLERAIRRFQSFYAGWTMGGKAGASLEPDAIKAASEYDETRSLYRAQHAGKRYVLALASGVNPDFDDPDEQGRQLSPRYVPVDTLDAAKAAAEDFRDSNDLGAGNWYNSEAGWVYNARTGKPVARIAYNGSVQRGGKLRARGR